METTKGRWALITGASAGIGKCFAEKLAQRGANLVLVARRVDRLDDLAEALQKQHNIRCLTIGADLADPKAPATIMNVIGEHNIAIDILVNNAGFGLPGSFCDSGWDAHRDFIELMVTSYAALTHHCLKGMIDRGYGRIIQVASVAGLVPGGQGHTLYGAVKALLVSFAQSLHAEYASRGVHTTALCPGFTYTEFHDVNNTRDLMSQMPDYMIMQVDPVVEGGLQAVERGHVVYVPGLVNKGIVWLAKALPRPWAAAMVKGNSKRFRRKSTD